MSSAASVNVASEVAEIVSRAGGRGPEIEECKQLPPDLAGTILNSRILQLLVPTSLGGAGGCWRSAFEAIEAVAQADGSAAWSLMIGTVGNMLTGYVPRDHAGDLFSRQSSPLYMAGVFEPRGIGRPAGKAHNYSVSGRWRFTTGIHLASWCCVGVVGNYNGARGVRQFVVRADDVKIHPNWDVCGLSGTGSDDIELNRHSADLGFSFTFDDQPWPTDSFWRVPFFSVASSLMAAAILGMARRGLDLSKGPSSRSDGIDENPCIDVEIASGEALLGAARAYVFECLEELLKVAHEGNVAPMDLRAKAWLAALHASWSARKVIDNLYEGASATSIRRESALQQCWRDIHAASHHVLISRQRLAVVGKHLRGQTVDAKPFL